MGRCNTGPCGADIQCFGKFDEIHSGGISATKKDGNLQANTRGTAKLRILHALPYLFEEWCPHQ